MTNNKYNVSPKLWRKFKSDLSKALYNSIMYQMLPNQDITTHPKTPPMPMGQWSTICHNAACYAVWALEGDPMKTGDPVELVNVKTAKVLNTTLAK